MKKLYRVSILLGIIILATTFFLLNDKIQGRFVDSQSYYSKYEQWKGSIDAIKKAPIYGYGIGDNDKALNAAYRQNNFQTSLLFTHNSHNLFLQTILEIGWIGLIVLILIFYYSVKNAFAESNYLLLFFIIIFAVTSITETTFGLFKGVVFFSFFMSLFTSQRIKFSKSLIVLEKPNL